MSQDLVLILLPIPAKTAQWLGLGLSNADIM